MNHFFKIRYLSHQRYVENSYCHFSKDLERRQQKIMTEFVRFLDADKKPRWANIRMDYRAPCWVGIAQTGVLVKKSKIGMFATKLYN
jgi:hypothetical protein